MLDFIKRIKEREDGIAFVEFAMVLPALLLMMFATIEYCHYVLLDRRANLVAIFSADYISRDDDGFFSDQERWIVEDIWMVMNPTARGARDLNGPWAHNYARSYSQISFTPDDPDCRSFGCKYEGKTDWVWRYHGGVSSPRYFSCEAEVKPNTAPQDGKTIPEGMIGRAPVVSVDLTYDYTPLIAGDFLSAHKMYTNAMRKVRLGTPINSGHSFTKNC